jgi:hypothetical protein
MPDGLGILIPDDSVEVAIIPHVTFAGIEYHPPMGCPHVEGFGDVALIVAIVL